MRNNRNSYQLTLFWQLTCGFLIIISSSCKKFVTIDPPATRPAGSSVYQSNATAAAVLTGIYDRMIEGNSMASGSNSISVLMGLYADELQNNNPQNQPIVQAYQNAFSSAQVPFWSQMYQYIFICNSAINGLQNSSGVTDEVKLQLVGEAKFLRAFFYYYLVNVFGNVPLITTTDYLKNSLASRSLEADVYLQIISDLTEARALLKTEYVSSDVRTATFEKVRPNKMAAVALLARIYLHQQDWLNAEAFASEVINSDSYQLSANLSDVFLKNSSEAIWQLQPIQQGKNTNDGQLFILQGAPSQPNPLTVSSDLLNAFEPTDQRKNSWVGSITENGETYYFPHKYKKGPYDPNGSLTEYLMVFRLAEPFLIRAEARAQQNNFNGAADDLNMIRNRAGLPNTPATDQASLLTAIQHERQVELFTEWGHRWFDLIRTDAADSVMGTVTPQKGGEWHPDKKLLPIPLSEIQKDPNLEQNQGY